MNVRRFVAPTAREALARVRAELGADAVVLRNRSVPGGVEILAMPDATGANDAGAQSGAKAATGVASGEPQCEALADPAQGGAQPIEASMSTVNFETYVRDRQARRQHAAQAEATAPRVPASATPEVHQRAPQGSLATRAATAAVATPHATTLQMPTAMTGESLARAHFAAAIADEPAGAGALMAELRAMRGLLSDQIESMNWFEGVRRRPAQARMLRLLLQAGFSASLSRTLVGHLPADFGDVEAQRWLREALRRNLRAAVPDRTIFDAGGVFALLGPTGVGKTTTAAKIAAQFALRYGAQSVGLITADVYRIGAQDQLRTFGRLIGVPVHVAHDVAGLADFLQLFMNRKLVLIDTAGVGQRDPRVGELLAALSTTQVRKVLVVNAAMQAEAIDEVAGAYQAHQAAGVVLSKVDETVQLGGALDCLIRRRLELQGVANGQRVPEDWHRPDAGALVDRALACAQSGKPTAFNFDEAELAMLMAARPDQTRAASALAEVRGV
ncbi:MAG: flagellar biosynthesis protein FlhF [Burkholderiaceae bacterium]|nr:flagellar biosynthesis protein FlhF [Burkholderiaceae bacterium]